MNHYCPYWFYRSAESGSVGFLQLILIMYLYKNVSGNSILDTNLEHNFHLGKKIVKSLKSWNKKYKVELHFTYI